MELNKKIKYILFALVILVLSIIFPNISKAWNPNLAGRFDEPDNGWIFWNSENTLLDQIKNTSSRYTAQRINIRFAMLYDRTDLHCLQHNYRMTGWQTYENHYYIEITGNTARNPETGGTDRSVFQQPGHQLPGGYPGKRVKQPQRRYFDGQYPHHRQRHRAV